VTFRNAAGRYSSTSAPVAGIATIAQALCRNEIGGQNADAAAAIAPRISLPFPVRRCRFA
jgi:hypothetical protein